MKKQSQICDILPNQVQRWRIVEKTVHELMDMYNFQEIRTSILQNYTELDSFQLPVTSILQLKQKYDNQSVYLRPEGTISVLHSEYAKKALENPQRLYYIGPMFKRINKQYQQIHQIGAEELGNDSVIVDAELIFLAYRLFEKLGINKAKLEINSYGCPGCKQQLDIERKERKELCPACKEHFAEFQKILSNLGMHFTVNRDLRLNYDYYNQIVFRFTYDLLEESVFLGQGGRYDDLASQFVGEKLSAAGFSIEIENVLRIMNQNPLASSQTSCFEVGLYSYAKDLDITMLQICHGLHNKEIKTVIVNRVNDKTINELIPENASIMIVLKPDLISEGKVQVRNMIRNHQQDVYISEIIDLVLRQKKTQHY